MLQLPFDITFAQPYILLLLLLLPLLIGWHSKKYRTAHPAIRLTTLSGLQHLRPSWRARLRPLLFVLRMLAIALLIIALARPQSSSVSENINSEGIDIVLAIDISGSMLAEDLSPNRIEAAKEVATKFVQRRSTDRIGLVVFSGESFTQTPITIDHNVVREQISNMKSGLLEDGTAIGMGLATAVDRLRSSQAKSKVVILLTDGVNNTGIVDPTMALEIAKAYKVRVYTIGVGTQGNAIYPVQTQAGIQRQMMPVQIDEALLNLIAKQTGGKYYRATDNRSLEKVYDEIDQLEKTKVQIDSFRQYTDLFFPLALAAILLLAIELLLRYTLFRSVT